jgi:hypothetical protein
MIFEFARINNMKDPLNPKDYISFVLFLFCAKTTEQFCPFLILVLQLGYSTRGDIFLELFVTPQHPVDCCTVQQ